MWGGNCLNDWEVVEGKGIRREGLYRNQNWPGFYFIYDNIAFHSISKKYATHYKYGIHAWLCTFKYIPDFSSFFTCGSKNLNYNDNQCNWSLFYTCISII